MIIVFCEECGARNMIDIDKIDKKKNHIICSACNDTILLPHGDINAHHDKIINTKKYKILIIDDDPTSLHILSSVLKNDYMIIMAENGNMGIELAQKEIPDLIISDIKMPGIDGYEVCKKLKDNTTTRHIPIIFVSGMHDTIDERRGFDVGCVDYIMKPVRSSILKLRLETHLKIKHIRDVEKRNMLELSQEIADLKKQLKVKEDNAKVKSENQSHVDIAIQAFFKNISTWSTLIVSKFIDEFEKSFGKLNTVEFLELFFKTVTNGKNEKIELMDSFDTKSLKDAIILLMFKKEYERRYGTPPEKELISIFF